MPPISLYNPCMLNNKGLLLQLLMSAPLLRRNVPPNLFISVSNTTRHAADTVANVSITGSQQGIIAVAGERNGSLARCFCFCF